MAGWERFVTKAGAELLAAAFGKIPNITRVAWGAGNVPVGELEDQTDVAGFVKDLSLLSVSSDGADTVIRAQLTNQGLAEAAPLSQLGVFATLDDGAETLLAIYQTDTPSTVATSAQQAGYGFEPELRIRHLNVAGFTGSVDWGAFVSFRALDDAMARILGELGDHVSNQGVHVTAEWKDNVAQAVNDLINHADDETIHVTEADKAAWNEAAAVALAALNLAQRNEGDITDLNGRVSRIEDSLFNGVTSNPFVIAFDNLTGLNVARGIWNATARRVEC